MPHRLKQRQEKIQEKRKQTPWREFVMEICSWKPLSIHKVDWKLSMYVDRIWGIISDEDFENWSRIEREVDKKMWPFWVIWDMFAHEKLPWLSHYWWLENCDFSSTAYWSKDCYLSFNISNAENVCYSLSVKDNSTNIYNSLMVYETCNNVYQSWFISHSYNIFFSKYIDNSSNMRYCSNMQWCKECILSCNQENKNYMIENVQYTKETYHEMKKKILREKSKLIAKQSKSLNYWSSNVEWTVIIKSEDIVSWLGVVCVHGWKNVLLVWSDFENTNFFDTWFAWAWWCSELYWSIDIAKSTFVFLSVWILAGSMIYYSYYLQWCSYCLGCIWLKNKSYCIYNKQYTKEERYDKVDEIFSQMEQNWTLGNFFPGSINPFYFNDTAAYLVDDSFTKREIEAAWYLWRDEKIAVDIPETMEIVKTNELDQYQWREGEDRVINPEILKKVIQDEEGNIYRVVKMEVDFLMKYGLPLPRKHRLERLKMNFKTI